MGEPSGPFETLTQGRGGSVDSLVRSSGSAARVSRVLRALEGLLLACEGGADDDFPLSRGTRVETPDLERDGLDTIDRRPGNTGKRPDCSNSVIVEWRAYKVVDSMSNAIAVAFMREQIDRATAAAKKLCTDKKCPDRLVEITYSDAGFRPSNMAGNYYWQEQFVLRVVLQLEVKCRLLV